MSIAVVTTFPNHAWDIYAKNMLESFVANWPAEVSLMVQLDDDLLAQQVDKILRPTDGMVVGQEADHKAFIERNKGKDDPQDYRKQAVRFCHKVFAIKRALDAIIAHRDANVPNKEPGPRYLVWLDADVVTTRKITLDEIKECLPKEGDAVAYLGRKDWPHSECGWLAFDLDNGNSEAIINKVIRLYNSDEVFKFEQWHDSWVWDYAMCGTCESTNLTKDKPGMDVWPHSPMGNWSTHHKGPQAKATLAQKTLNTPPQQMQKMPVQIQTRNALPDETLCEHIRQNQLLIKNWIEPCKPNNEEIVVVSAGPMLIAEDVRKEVAAGRRIVAVKHALEPLKKAGIKPWACILLDPRPHVASFVENPDTDVIWLVASQVDPNATAKLLEAGCTVWGYHASVGAGEHKLTKKQEYAVISGGSATATRGLYVLKHLGFSNLHLYGYDLCFPEKPDLNSKDDIGQPKYLEISVGFSHPLFNLKRAFWTEPQLVAQFEELNDMIKGSKFKLTAEGQGVVPFILKAKGTGELREAEWKHKVYGRKRITYNKLFKCSNKKKTAYSMMRRLLSLPTLRRTMPTIN